MLKINVVGECYVGGSAKKKKVSYKESFELGNELEIRALQVIQRMLLEGRLKKTVKDYCRWATCEIEEIKSDSKSVKILAQKDLEKLERQDLVEYLASSGVFLKGSILGRVKDMRAKAPVKAEKKEILDNSPEFDDE